MLKLGASAVGLRQLQPKIAPTADARLPNARPP